MGEGKQKLELTWIGKENRPKLEPRILLEDQEKSYHAANRVTDKDIFDNRLIFGDNLLALKALEQEFAGKIKCIFIDPPYNTGSAFEHYDDGIEHSLWLSLMRDRLEMLLRLLSGDGSIWITIDDNEAHYLKLLCDEIFGRKNFVANSIWQKVYSERMDATGFSVSHDHVLIYRKADAFVVNQVSKDQNSRQFNFFDEEVGKHYRRRSLRKEGSESLHADRPSMWYSIKAPDGKDIWPVKPDGTEGRWRWKKENVAIKSQMLEFVKKDGNWEIYVKQFLEESATRPPGTIWLQEEVGHNHEAKLEVKAFNNEQVFDTPKPERLIKRILELGSNTGDLVLDSFAGSGTTGAVAHKMGRRWIMVELGEHCHTHIIPRMQKVIDGTDQGGISKAVNWKGGGGFRYFRLAPSLLAQDKRGNWVISKEYNAAMLASAMAKHEGFIYNPDETLYWKQGRSTEKDYIFTTTNFITLEYLDSIHEEMQPDESLLICCKSFQKACEDRYANITVRKIPNMLLGRCEFGKDDYILNVAGLPWEDNDRPSPDARPEGKGSTKTTKKSSSKNQQGLFDGEGE
jgi:adenine-specific DNA-methyltransferase